MAKYKQQNGFTLVEAVVTTAIVTAMSALVVIGTNSARESLRVRNAAQQFASDLRETVLITKNGVNASGCNWPVSVKRGCSTYTMQVNLGSTGYTRKVVAGTSEYEVTNFSLPAGLKFSDGTASTSTVSSVFSFAFPSVNISTPLNLEVVSENNSDVKMNVCVTQDGTVSVKAGSDPC